MLRNPLKSYSGKYIKICYYKLNSGWQFCSILIFQNNCLEFLKLIKNEK